RVAREPLLAVPGVAAVDRASHPGADPCERVELLDRRVGAVRDDCTGGTQRLECVRAVGLPGPEPVGEVTVRRRVRELHRARDAELCEAGEILRPEQLAVLDAV